MYPDGIISKECPFTCERVTGPLYRFVTVLPSFIVLYVFQSIRFLLYFLYHHYMHDPIMDIIFQVGIGQDAQ